jgi:acyl carrier protein
MSTNKSDIEKYIFELLKEEYNIDAVLDSETNIQDAGMDSLDIVSFLFNIEKKYNVKIPDEELEKREMLIIKNIVSYVIRSL